MKIKILLMAALLGAASLPAHAGVRFGFGFGLPVPVPVVVAPPVAVGYYGAPGCVYAPGYWGGGYGRTWVGGGWHYGPGRGYGHPYYGRFHR